jgi:hypothetical protein
MLNVKQVVNWIVAFTTPIFLAHSSYGVYFLFSGACLFTSAVCVVFMPETRGKTLEDIDASFRRDHSAVVDAHKQDSYGLLDTESRKAGVVTSSAVR